MSWSLASWNFALQSYLASLPQGYPLGSSYSQWGQNVMSKIHIGLFFYPAGIPPVHTHTVIGILLFLNYLLSVFHFHIRHFLMTIIPADICVQDFLLHYLPLSSCICSFFLIFLIKINKCRDTYIWTYVHTYIYSLASK